jgi:predicted transcriptional regulator
MSALTVRIPAELRQKLQKHCKQQHRSPSEVVRESLRRYLAAERLRQTRQKLRPYARAAGILTDEDVFQVVS